MAGSYDYLLRVVAADLDDYQRFQMERLIGSASGGQVQSSTLTPCAVLTRVSA
jgi:hypothetical protein